LLQINLLQKFLKNLPSTMSFEKLFEHFCRKANALYLAGFVVGVSLSIIMTNKWINNMEKKIQIFIIHGGMTFKNKKDYLHFLKTREVSIEEKIRWTDEFLKKNLGQNFDIIRPRMPLQDNAKYGEWKIYFEKGSRY